MKYIVLAYSNDITFDIPRHLVEINGEPLVKRTIRLLKENGINDIIITAKDPRFDNLGATRYEPVNSDYNYKTGKGYWLNAFPFELMDEPVCFIWGDVYFSEQAIKTIVETDTKSMLFFCSYNNKDPRYIKEHDEPLAYKIIDTELFKEHVNKVKKMKDEGKCCREPIVWEVYRSINGQDINTHIMTKNFVAINDISCDIDSRKDLERLKEILGGKEMVKCKALETFSLNDFNKLKNLIRGTNATKEGYLFEGDTFECDKELANYLTGENSYKRAFVKVIEIIPDKEIIEYNEEPKKIEAVLTEVEAPKKAKMVGKSKKTKLTKKK